MTTDPYALIRMLARVRVTLTVEGGTLIYYAPRRVVTPELVQALRDHKRVLMRALVPET